MGVLGRELPDLCVSRIDNTWLHPARSAALERGESTGEEPESLEDKIFTEAAGRVGANLGTQNVVTVEVITTLA